MIFTNNFMQKEQGVVDAELDPLEMNVVKETYCELCGNKMEASGSSYSCKKCEVNYSEEA